MPGVGLMVRVVGLGSYDPEFKSHSAFELIPGGVDSACHPSEVRKMSASMVVYCVGVVTRPGLCPIAKESATAAPMLCKEYGPNGWMDGVAGGSLASCGNMGGTYRRQSRGSETGKETVEDRKTTDLPVMRE